MLHAPQPQLKQQRRIMSSPSIAPAAPASSSILAPQYRATTFGMVALISLIGAVFLGQHLDRAALAGIALIASGKVDLKPLISASIPFVDSIAGFDRAVEARDTDVKLQIVMPE